MCRSHLAEGDLSKLVEKERRIALRSASSSTQSAVPCAAGRCFSPFMFLNLQTSKKSRKETIFPLFSTFRLLKKLERRQSFLFSQPSDF